MGGTTAAERIGSNVGPARYRLRLQLWLALLSRRLDSYVLHDVSVVDIVETVFAEYSGSAAARRSDITDGRRDHQVPGNRPDLCAAFVAEEGIYYWLERAGGRQVRQGVCIRWCWPATSMRRRSCGRFASIAGMRPDVLTACRSGWLLSVGVPRR